MNSLAITLAQINPTVGALEHNADLVLDAASRAAKAGADVVVFPELVLSGYPPEDLVLKRHFIEDVEVQLARIASSAPAGVTLLVGAPVMAEGHVFNAAVVIQDGATSRRYHKMTCQTTGYLMRNGCLPKVISLW
jgi:NAD+ synthase (glutamine-hydrolysing)